MKKIKLHDIEESILSEVDLLNDIIKFPNKYDRDIFLSILVNQKNFSLYENKEHGIISTSLNTHKYYANIYLASRYIFLNQLRIKAYNILKKYNYENKDLKKNSKKDIDNIIFNKTIENNFNLIKIIYELKSLLSHISSCIDDNNLKNEINSKLFQIENLIRFTKENENG